MQNNVKPRHEHEEKLQEKFYSKTLDIYWSHVVVERIDHWILKERKIMEVEEAYSKPFALDLMGSSIHLTAVGQTFMETCVNEMKFIDSLFD